MTQEEVKKKKRKKILLILFIAFNAAVIIVTALSEFARSESAAELSEVKINWLFLLPAAGCWVVAVASEIAKYCIMMKKKCGHVNFKLMVETVLLGRYYDNITPSGVGGQPFQIYHMSKHGMSSGDSAAIPLIGFVSMQFGFIILALISFIFGGALLKIDFIKVTSYIGLIFYAFFPVVIVLFAFFESGMQKIMSWLLQFLTKIKIVKDYYATSVKWSKNVKEYAVAVKEIVKNVSLSLQVMLLSFIYQIGICSIPYFVLRAFGGNMDYISCFVTTMAIYATITFIPTPGNAGAAEGSFYVVFSSLTTGYIFWAMLTWRFFVYYLFIIIGLGIYAKLFVHNRKLRAQAHFNPYGPDGYNDRTK